jgi:hypothetical protein
MKGFFKPLERLLDGPVKPDHDEKQYEGFGNPLYLRLFEL